MAPRVLQEKHLKLKVEARPRAIDALGWGWAARTPRLEPGQQVDLAFTLDKNTFQEIDNLQLIIKDLVVTS